MDALRWLLAALLCLLPAQALAQLGGGISKGNLTVSDSRLFDWTQVGAFESPGGVPDTTNATNWPVLNTDSLDAGGCTHFTSTDKSGASDMVARIQCWINYATTLTPGGGRHGTVVLLGAGTFLLNEGSGQLFMKKNVVLKGSGVGTTLFHDTGANWPTFCASNFCAIELGSEGQGAGKTLASDLLPGATTIVFSSDPGYAPGTYFYVSEDGATDPRMQGGNRCCLSPGIVGTFRISLSDSGTGATRTIDRSPYLSELTAYGAAAHSFTSPVTNAGLENFSMDWDTAFYSTVAPKPFQQIGVTGCFDCWISNVDASYANGGVSLNLTRNVTIQHSQFHDIIYNIQGNFFEDMLISMGGGTVDSLVWDNRFSSGPNANSAAEATVKFQGAAQHNVWAYNYTWGLSQTNARDCWSHGGYPLDNLFEGNAGDDTECHFDNFWGQDGPNSVFYRQRYLATVVSHTATSGQNLNAAGFANEDTIGTVIVADKQTILLSTFEDVSSFIGDGIGHCDLDQMCGSNSGNGTATNIYAEKNRFTDLFVDGHDAPIASTNYVADATVYAIGRGFFGPTIKNSTHQTTPWFSTGYSGLSPYSGLGTTFPPSFFITAAPSWWCSGTAFPTIGADVDVIQVNVGGKLHSVADSLKTPAQRAKEGLACNTSCSATTPVASFTCTPLSVISGQTITCTDASSNTPTSWSWNSPTGGCTTTTPTAQNPVFTCTGVGTTQSISLGATNCAGTGSTTRANYITVTAAPSLQFTGLPLVPPAVPQNGAFSPTTGTFSVCNQGGGVATGTVTLSPSTPQSISPGTFTSLGAGQCAVQTVTYSSTQSPGTYVTSVSAQGSGLTTITNANGITVTIQTPAALAITAGATQTLTALQGNSPGAFSFTIQNTGQATLTNNIVCTAANTGYYSTNPVTTITQPILGGASNIVTVTPTMTGLTSAGSPYSDTITCAATGVSSVTVSVAITITSAGTAPDYQIAITGGGKTLVAGQVSTFPSLISLIGTTFGSSQMGVTVSSDTSWLSLNSASGTGGSWSCTGSPVTCTGTFKTNTQLMSATLDTTGLSPNTYSVTITAQDSPGNCLNTAAGAATCPTHTAVAKIVVTPPPTASFGGTLPASFGAVQNSTPPSPVVFNLCNLGTGTLNTTVNSTDAYTTISGTTTGLVALQCNPITLSFLPQWTFRPASPNWNIGILVIDSNSTPVGSTPEQVNGTVTGTLSPSPVSLPR